MDPKLKPAVELLEAYDGLRGRNLSIDMTRGKPSPEQLDLSEGLLEAMSADDCRGEDGADGVDHGGTEHGQPANDQGDVGPEPGGEDADEGVGTGAEGEVALGKADVVEQ